MDTKQMVAATRFHRLAVSLTFDPSADDSEKWVACIGFDSYGAGSTADEALNNAMNREALGPEPLPAPDDEGDWLIPLPFDDEPDGDDDHGLEDPAVFGWLPVRAGRR